jgi:hypothetical protein
MVNVSELKEGDVVKVLFDGGEREGTVVRVDREENMACINNGIQEFWYPSEEIVAVPITEERLMTLFGFEKEETEQGVKYKKGVFRMLVHDPGNFTNFEIWYREDHRHFHQPLYVHELQNRHLEMSKVPLERVTTH